MADKGTTGQLPDELESIGERLLDSVLARTSGIVEFAEDQAEDLKDLVGDIGDAIKGDEHAESAVKAILLLKKFTGEARAYLELAAVRAALVEAMEEIGGALIDVGAKLVVKGLVSALKSAGE